VSTHTEYVDKDGNLVPSTSPKVRDWRTVPDPQPGDVVVLNGEYTGVRNGARAVIDGARVYEDDEFMVVFGASAFRGPSSKYAPDQTPYVSCSGGPCPPVKVADLKLLGQTEQTFWRWKDLPRADGGEYYVETVNLWEWKR